MKTNLDELPRLKLAKHWKLVHPQLMHVADKTFLVIMKEPKFVYDIDRSDVEDTFLRELSKIKKHHDSHAF